MPRKPKNPNLHDQLVREGVVTVPKPHRFDKPRAADEPKPLAANVAATPVVEREIEPTTPATGLQRAINANVAKKNNASTQKTALSGLQKAIDANIKLQRERSK